MTYEDIINYEALAVYDSQIKKWVKELTPQHTEEIYNLLLSHLGDGYRLMVDELQPSRPSRVVVATYEYICNVEVDGEIYLRWDRFGRRNIKTMYDRDRFTVFTSINHEIGSGVFVIDEDGDFVVDSSKKVKEYGSFTFASKEDVKEIVIPTEDLANLTNQERMLMALNVAEQIPELVAMTDEEILKAYDGYDVAGEHTMGIADQTYGHLVPAEVTIDSVPFTMYQERTYAAYGYTTLYDAQGQQIDINKHPEEGEHLFTVQPEPEPDPVNVTIDGVEAEVDSTKTYAENGYSAIYKNNDAADATADYPQEGDVLVTDPNVVDLGLSVLWCRTNLGAASNTEVGKYYSWANTDGHLTHRSGNFDAFDDAYFNQSYYNNTPGALFTGVTLDAEHDAAMVESDGVYCIPSEAQMSELIALDKTVIMDGDLPIAIKFSGNGGELVIPFGKHGKDDYVPSSTQLPASAEVWVNGSNKNLYAASASNVYIAVSNKFYGLNIRPVKPISNE